MYIKNLYMYYKIKVSKLDNKNKPILTTYFTDALNFAEAAQKVINIEGIDCEVEDISLMKNYKPAVNEVYSNFNKLYLVKIAEDVPQDNGTTKTLKYVLPAFANNSDDLQKIMRDYISQGLENMRLTTISETRWIYIK